MKYYQIYGLRVSSDFDIVEAFEIEKPEVIDLSIHFEQMSEEYIMVTDKEKKSITDSIMHFSEDWACIRSAGEGTFQVSKGNEISYYLFDGWQREFVEAVLLCFCMPIALLQRKTILVHGSGILFSDKTLLISGESGAGKSSLTNEIVSRGYKQMADDTVAIEKETDGMYGYATFPLRKLCADAVEKLNIDKDRLTKVIDPEREKYGLLLKDEYYPGKAKLGAMVIIRVGDVEKPQLEEIKGAEKLKYFTQNLYTKGMYEQTRYPKECYFKCVMIAGSMPIYLLTRPADRMTVKEQADLVEKALS